MFSTKDRVSKMFAIPKRWCAAGEMPGDVNKGSDTFSCSHGNCDYGKWIFVNRKNSTENKLHYNFHIFIEILWINSRVFMIKYSKGTINIYTQHEQVFVILKMPFAVTFVGNKRLYIARFCFFSFCFFCFWQITSQINYKKIVFRSKATRHFQTWWRPPRSFFDVFF